MSSNIKGHKINGIIDSITFSSDSNLSIDVVGNFILKSGTNKNESFELKAKFTINCNADQYGDILSSVFEKGENADFYVTFSGYVVEDESPVKVQLDGWQLEAVTRHK